MAKQTIATLKKEHQLIVEDLRRQRAARDNINADLRTENDELKTDIQELEADLKNARADAQLYRAESTHYKRQRDVLIGFIEGERRDRELPPISNTVTDNGRHDYINVKEARLPRTYLDRFLIELSEDYHHRGFDYAR